MERSKATRLPPSRSALARPFHRDRSPLGVCEIVSLAVVSCLFHSYPKVMTSAAALQSAVTSILDNNYVTRTRIDLNSSLDRRSQCPC